MFWLSHPTIVGAGISWRLTRTELFFPNLYQDDCWENRLGRYLFFRGACEAQVKMGRPLSHRSSAPPSGNRRLHRNGGGSSDQKKRRRPIVSQTTARRVILSQRIAGIIVRSQFHKPDRASRDELPDSCVILQCPKYRKNPTITKAPFALYAYRQNCLYQITPFGADHLQFAGLYCKSEITHPLRKFALSDFAR